MSARTENRSAAAERVHHRTNVWHQLAVFVGLFLSPVIGLFAAWLIHLWAAGVHIHFGQVNRDINTPKGMPTVVAILLSLITVFIAHKAWQFTEHRKDPLRRALAGSVLIVGVMFAIGAGVGPSYLWSGLFFIATWAVAIVWSIARLDVARNDKTNDDHSEGFLEKHGLKNWWARKVTPVAGKDGKPMATEIEFEHAEGDTVDQLQEAVGNFESATGSPAGLSRATPTDRADRSKLTIMHTDPLVTPTEIPAEPSPGGSITDPIYGGIYTNGEWVRIRIAGGLSLSPSAYLFMGMTRSGKTWEENTFLTGVISRRNSVILYLNKAKGLQDARIVLPGIEAAVIADEEGATGLYKEAFRQIKRIMGYRQRQLALFGINEWSAEQCFDNPPWRTDETGKRVQMEPMPALIVHVGEADAILYDEPAAATYVTSKGLSLGVIPGYSLQRADATKMPTGLRFNLMTAWCFGCGDSDSATMALSDWVVKAGAHPENWKARKQGYFYFEGLDVNEEFFPMPARSFSLGPNGSDLREELLKRNLYWGPRMAKLDRGSANATAEPGRKSWWDLTAEATALLRDDLLKGAAPADPQTAPQSDPQTDDDDEKERHEVDEEMREMTEVDGVELYPADEETGDRATFADATAPPAPRSADQVSWEDDRPAARDRKSALIEFARTLDELMGRRDLRDPADPTGNTVIVTAGQIFDSYKYRSRPFFSEALNGIASGAIGHEECPTDKIVTPAPDLGAAAGKYRIMRPRAGHVG